MYSYSTIVISVKFHVRKKYEKQHKNEYGIDSFQYL